MRANVIINTEMNQETDFELAANRGAELEAVGIKPRLLLKKELTLSQVSSVFWHTQR